MIEFKRAKTGGLRGLSVYRAEIPEGGVIYMIETGGGVAAVHVAGPPASLESVVAMKIAEAAAANETPPPIAEPPKKAPKKKAPKKKASK